MPNGGRHADSARALRYRLTLHLHAAGQARSIAELAGELVRSGVPLPAGDLSKRISDSLRWEIGHGRVVRAGRGRFAPGHVPRSTLAWMRHQLAGWDATARRDTAPLSAHPEAVRPPSTCDELDRTIAAALHAELRSRGLSEDRRRPA